MLSIISTCKITGTCTIFTTEKNLCLSSLNFIRLIEHVEESKENVLASSDILKRMNGNLNSNTLGKEIKKLFIQTCTSEENQNKRGLDKKENLYDGIFWKADATKFIPFTNIPSLFSSDFFPLRTSASKEIITMGYMMKMSINQNPIILEMNFIAAFMTWNKKSIWQKQFNQQTLKLIMTSCHLP